MRCCRACLQICPHALGTEAQKIAPARSVSGSPPTRWGQTHEGEFCSSPQRWGRTVMPAGARCLGRLTPPMRWGWTRAVTPAARGRTAHPHAVGTDRIVQTYAGCLNGSPPRGGRTTGPSRPSGSRPAHPHAVGPDPRRPRTGRSQAGSPPRCGDGPVGARDVVPDPGLTPTRWGRTPAGPRAATRSRAHPHAVRTDPVPGGRQATGTGSPPPGGDGRPLVRHELVVVGLTPRGGDGRQRRAHDG